jgi:hypothetical protein
MLASSSTIKIRTGALRRPAFCTGKAEGALKTAPANRQAAFRESSAASREIELYG